MKVLPGKQLRTCVHRGAASLIVAATLIGGTAHAGLLDFVALNDGKVLATPGVQMTDGAAGGGITPWAVIAGYETRDGINGNVHYTYVNLPNYSLNSIGASIGFFDRFEISYTNDVLPTGSTFDTVGLVTNTLNGLLSDPTLGPVLNTLGLTGTADTGIRPWNTTIRMNVVGAKLRVFGEAIYDSDNLIPQVSIGGFYKWNANKQLLKTLGADKADDWEAYISATKIFFPIDTLINVTVRYSSANQTGLVGFGGPNGNHKTFRPEVSVAYLLAKNTAIGGEWQQHSSNLSSVHLGGLNLSSITNNPLLSALPVTGTTLGALSTTLTQQESDWYDAFVAFFPNKHLSITMAYAMLGNITLTPSQNGYYISLQASF